MLDQKVFMLSVDEYQKKTGKSWDVLKAVRLLAKSANHKGFIVDSVITVQYLKFYRDGGVGQFGVRVFDNMPVAQQWLKQNYHYDQLDDDLVTCLKNDQGDVLDLRTGYEEDPDMLKDMVIVQKQMLVHEVK